MARYGYTFDPFELTGVRVPPSRREKAKEAVMNYLKEEALSWIGRGKSPVEGDVWKTSLSPEYRKHKAQESSSKFANLELSGDLLDHLDVADRAGKKLFYGVEGGRDLIGKAEGNNIGSYGREPVEDNARRFVPIDGETFRPAIINGMRKVLQEFADDE